MISFPFFKLFIYVTLMGLNSRYLDYASIRFRSVKVTYKGIGETKVIEGKCFDNPLQPRMKGSGCVLVRDIGLFVNETNYITYIPVSKIENIYVLEDDNYSKIITNLIVKSKNMPEDIGTAINEFVDGWKFETKVQGI